MKLTVSQLWCPVVGDATAGSTKILADQGSNPAQFLYFDPDNTIQMPGQIVNLCRPFVRYRLCALELVYVPGCPTSTTGTIAFGWDSDAADATPTTVTGIQQYANSVAGSPWMPMRLKCPCDGTLRYMFNSAASTSLITAEKRQDMPGGIVAATSVVAAATNYGQLRFNFEIELYEMNPTNVQSSLVAPRDLCPSCRLINFPKLRADPLEPDCKCHGSGLHQTPPREEKKEKGLEVFVVDETLTPPPSSRSLVQVPPVLLTSPAGRTASAKA